jgi:hypothetical protein
MIWPRFLALRVIRSLGFEVRRVADPNDLPIASFDTDPITLEYCLSKRGYAVFQIPLDETRAFHSLALPLQPTHHPFVRAFESAARATNPDRARSEIETVLTSYYATVQPSSAAEVVGLTEDEAPGLQAVPPIGYILPWWEMGAREMTRGRERSLKYLGLRYGISTAADAGHTFFGPIHRSRLELQVKRLEQLRQSVRQAWISAIRSRFPDQGGRAPNGQPVSMANRRRSAPVRARESSRCEVDSGSGDECHPARRCPLVAAGRQRCLYRRRGCEAFRPGV